MILQSLQKYEVIADYIEEEETKDTKRELPPLKEFIQTYFSHYITAPFGEIQDRLIEAVETLQGRETRDKAIRQSIAAPRGFAKSSVVTLFGVLWLVLKKEHRFVVILSSIKGTAENFLQAIIDEVEQNEKLIEDFPELNPAKDFKGQTVAWRDSEIVFSSGVRIMAMGFMNSVRGLRKKNARPDLIIADDPDEEKDVLSESTMSKKYRWFERAVLRLGGKLPVDVFVCYTTIAHNCLGEYIYTDKLKYGDWIKHKYRAIELRNGEEVSTWPEAYTIEDLQKEREEDPLGFATEKQNEPLAEVNQVFKGIVQTWTFNRSMVLGSLTLAVDPSLGKTETSDYSAIVGTACTPEGKFLEIYNSIERRPPDKIVSDLIQALKLFKWDILGIEQTGNQEHFIILFKEMLKKHNIDNPEEKIIIPIEGINSTSEKIKRVTSSIQPLVKSGLLLLRDDSAMLYDQLDNFPYKKKDGPDALEMSVGLHRLVGKGKINVSSSSKGKQIDNAEAVQRQIHDRIMRQSNYYRTR